MLDRCAEPEDRVVWLLRTAMMPMMPARDDLPGLEREPLDSYLRRFLAEANAATILGVSLAAMVFLVSPLITIGIPLPSCWLSEQQVDRHAHKVSTSPLYLVQQAIFLLKMYAGFAWGEQQAVRESLALAPYPAHQPAWRQ